MALALLLVSIACLSTVAQVAASRTTLAATTTVNPPNCVPTFPYSIQWPRNVKQAQRYNFSDCVHYMMVRSSDDAAHSAASKTDPPRTEMRIKNDYTTGVHTIAFDMLIPSGTSGVAVFQISGGKTSDLQLRVYNGTLKRYNKETLATNIYDRWMNLLISHDTATRKILIYIDGQLALTTQDQSVGNHYFKLGVYAQPVSSTVMEAKFRYLVMDGRKPGQVTVTVKPPPPRPPPPPPVNCVPTFSYLMQKPYDLLLPQRYNFSNCVHYMWVRNDDKPHQNGSDTGPRTEMRVLNDYTTGVHTMAFDMLIPSGTSGVTVMQIFGGNLSYNPSGYAFSLQLYVVDGKLTNTGVQTLATNIYDKWTSYFISHDTATRQILIYINQQLVLTTQDRGTDTHYFKLGVYGSKVPGVSSTVMEAKFRYIVVT